MLVISPSHTCASLPDGALVYPIRAFSPGTRGKKMTCLHCTISFGYVMPGIFLPVKAGESGEADEGAVG